jgi:hypothetical protein
MWLRVRRYLLAFGASALFVAAPSCVTDTCACTTVPPFRQQQWNGSTSVGDSLALDLRTADVSMQGSVVLRSPGMPPRSLTVEGVADGVSDAPVLLTFHGWYAQPVTWTRTTPRSDSLYGVIRLPTGTSAGDTLGLFLRRAR